MVIVLRKSLTSVLDNSSWVSVADLFSGKLSRDYSDVITSWWQRFRPQYFYIASQQRQNLIMYFLYTGDVNTRAGLWVQSMARLLYTVLFSSMSSLRGRRATRAGTTCHRAQDVSWLNNKKLRAQLFAEVVVNLKAMHRLISCQSLINCERNGRSEHLVNALYLLQRNSFHVTLDHAAQGSTQVVNYSRIWLFGQQVGKHRQHHGIVSGTHFCKEHLYVHISDCAHSSNT